MPKRCALGCPYISGRTYHHFPHTVRNPERFKAWVCVAGGTLASQDEIEIYRKKVLCDIHFTDKDKNRNNRLNFLAVPTLHLGGKADEVDSAEKEVRFNMLSEVQQGLEGIPKKCIENDAVTDESGTQGVKRKPEESIGLSDHETSTQGLRSDPILDLPSESNKYLTGLLDQETLRQVPESQLVLGLPSISYEILIGSSDYKASTHVSPMSETILDFPSPISKETFTISEALDITSARTSPILKSNNKSFRDEPPASRHTETVICPDWINNDNLKEHSYCAQDKTDITKIKESKYHQPIPPLIVNQLQTARKRVKQLQSEINRLRKRNKIVKTRLINAKKNSKHNCLQNITQNMTAAAKTFTHMQFTQTQKKNAGRRFTSEGQQLSLSIYKSSPQCYDLLSKLFTLPSTKTLKRYRKQFDIQPGLNNSLEEGPIQLDTLLDEPYMHSGDIF